MINTRIIFSYQKDVVIQYLPIFSIQRCPDNFPKPDGGYGGHYPYFLDFRTNKVSGKKGVIKLPFKIGESYKIEYSYKIGEPPKFEDYRPIMFSDRTAQMDEDNRVLSEVIPLANALSENNFFTYRGRRHWTINLDKEIMDDDKLCFGQEGYISPDYERKLEAVPESNNYEHIDPILFTYKSIDNNELKYVVRLGDLFELYFSSTDDIFKKKYLNACIVFEKSLRLLEIDQSAAYIFLVSTIEALIEIEYENVSVGNCKECGQPQYKVRRKFHDFLEKYCIDIDKKTKDIFCNIRNGIAHSGQLLGASYNQKWIIENQEDFDLKYKTVTDRMYYESLKSLVQTCLRTFLYQNLRSTTGAETK